MGHTLKPKPMHPYAHLADAPLRAATEVFGKKAWQGRYIIHKNQNYDFCAQLVPIPRIAQIVCVA